MLNGIADVEAKLVVYLQAMRHIGQSPFRIPSLLSMQPVFDILRDPRSGQSRVVVELDDVAPMQSLGSD